MTRVEREEVEHTVETVTVETVHCDICGGEAETYSTFDIGNETKHAHEDCLKKVAHASPIDSQPNHEENDDTALPIIPPVIQAFFDSDIPKTVVQNTKRGLPAATVFALWPITGLWLAERETVAGVRFESDGTPLSRYVKGYMAMIFALPLLVLPACLIAFGFHPMTVAYVVLSFFSVQFFGHEHEEN